MILFEASIKSKYTKMNYMSHLNQFKKYTNVSDQNQLLEISIHDLQIMLENYAIHLRHTAHPNSIPSRFKGIKHFCIINGISINWDIIYKMFPQKQKTHDLRSYTTAEVRGIVHSARSIRDKALIHFLASTGARIGVFDHALSIKHMKKLSDGSCAVLLYAGDVEEYWSFLTPQAFRALDAYHSCRRKNNEIFDEETAIFTTCEKIPKPLGWSGARSVVARTISKSKIRRCKQSNRYDIQTNHGFRKRFNTILKMNNSVNYNIAEKLMGHRNGLDGVYFTPTVSELFAEFEKIIPKLEI